MNSISLNSVCSHFAVACALVLICLPIHADEPAPDVESPRLPDLQLPESPPLSRFDAILERPLFSASRAPADEVDAGLSGTSAEELKAQWRLTGILLAGTEYKAMLRQRNGRLHRVLSTGMPLDDTWVLTEIHRTSILLQAGDNEVQMQLLEPRDTEPRATASNRTENGTGAAASQPDAPQIKEVPNE